MVVTGLLGDQQIEIDGRLVPIHEGAVALDGLLNEPGLHLVRAGRIERTIEMVEGAVNARLDHCSLEPARFGVGVPAGEWVFLGKNPGEAFSPARTSFRSVFAAPPFDPVWAVAAGFRGGARAHCLSPVAGPPSTTKLPSSNGGRRALERWATTIYSANIRRAALSACVPMSADALSELWSTYASSAREIKRRLRRRSR